MAEEGWSPSLPLLSRDREKKEKIIKERSRSDPQEKSMTNAGHVRKLQDLVDDDISFVNDKVIYFQDNRIIPRTMPVKKVRLNNFANRYERNGFCSIADGIMN